MGAVETKGGSQVVRGMFHLFLGNTSSTLMLAASTIIVGKILGPANYGLYTIALIVPPFLYNAIRFGLDSAAARYSARLRSEGRDLDGVNFVYASSVFSFLTAALFSIIFVIISGSVARDVLNRPEIANVVLPIAMLSVVGQAAYTVTNLGMVGLGKANVAGLLQAVQGFTRLVVAAGLVVLGYGVVGAVVGYTAGFAVSGLVSLIFLFRMTGLRVPRGFRNDLTTGLRYGFPVYISTLATGFSLPAINALLALMVANSEVGGFAAALTFNTLIVLFTYPISTLLFPLFSRKVDEPRLLGEMYGRALRFTALLVLPLTVFIMAFAVPMMVTFYTRAYTFAASYLLLTAALSLLVGLGGQAYVQLLNGVGHTRDALVATAVGSGVSVAIAYLAIPYFGVPGAVVGQLVGGLLALAIGTWAAKARLKVSLGLIGTWKFYVAAGVAGGLCYPLSWLITHPFVSLVVGALALVALYIPALALLRALDKEDLGNLRGYLGFTPLISVPLGVAIRYYEYASRASNKKRALSEHD